MADEETNGAVETAPKTEADLTKEMQDAMKTGDFKAVAKVAQELVKFQKAKEAAELEAKQQALAAVTEEVKAAIEKALKPLIDSGKLDQADGIWYTNDFGEKLVACRTMKNQTKAKTGGGGGGGKKFSVSTTELLEKFGSEEYKDGLSYQAYWDANPDKNARYGVRESLLKKGGYTS